MSKQNLSFINGNHQRYLKTSPSVMVLGKMNDVALAHLKKQTGLNFKDMSPDDILLKYIFVSIILF